MYFLGSQTVLKIFGIAGFKNAGKTTLVVELIREFTARGLRVATIKHAHHEFDIDQPGKDSHQHRAAGATEVIVASDRRWAHISELADRPKPGLNELITHLGAVDLVLIEGYKHGSHPKIELRRAGVDNPRLASDDPAVKAIVCDFPLAEEGVPVLARADVALIADFIMSEAADFQV